MRLVSSFCLVAVVAVLAPATTSAQQAPAPVAARIAVALEDGPALLAGDVPSSAVLDVLGLLPAEPVALEAADCGALGGPDGFRWWGLYDASGFVVYGQTTGCLLMPSEAGAITLYATLDTGADAFDVASDWIGVALPSTAPERPVTTDADLPAQFDAGVLQVNSEGLVWTGSDGAATRLGPAGVDAIAVAGEAGEVVILVTSADNSTLWGGRRDGAVEAAQRSR